MVNKMLHDVQKGSLSDKLKAQINLKTSESDQGLLCLSTYAQQTHKVTLTSLQRRCNVTTLQRRCNDVVCLLGVVCNRATNILISCPNDQVDSDLHYPHMA